MRRIALASLLSLAWMTAAHASEWAGSSLSLRASMNGMYCQAGAVRLSIDGDSVNGSGNGISLAGKIAANGAITLSGGAGAKQVSFTGKKTGERIKGAWIEALTGCGGTWNAQMVAADQPPSQTGAPDGSDDASIYMEQPDEASPGEDATDKSPEGGAVTIPPKTDNQ